jgi:lysophospholipase L1-like esterase
MEQLLLPLTRLSLVALTLASVGACASGEGRPPATASAAPGASTSVAAPESATAAEAPPEGTAAEAAAPEPPAETTPAAESTASEGAPEFPKGSLVLHIGDSFAASLGVPLGKRLKAAGVRYILEYQTASYVPTWAFGEELPKFIGRYNPDFVIVTLGANEIEIPNPEQRAGAVKRLIKELGARPCLWILPPLWKQDTGFMKVIADNAAPCRSLDSTALMGDLPRKRDKVHPNDEGRERWADAVMSWLGREREPHGERPWSLKSPH